MPNTLFLARHLFFAFFRRYRDIFIRATFLFANATASIWEYNIKHIWLSLSWGFWCCPRFLSGYRTGSVGVRWSVDVGYRDESVGIGRTVNVGSSDENVGIMIEWSVKVGSRNEQGVQEARDVGKGGNVFGSVAVEIGAVRRSNGGELWMWIKSIDQAAWRTKLTFMLGKETLVSSLEVFFSKSWNLPKLNKSWSSSCLSWFGKVYIASDMRSIKDPCEFGSKSEFRVGAKPKFGICGKWNNPWFWFWAKLEFTVCGTRDNWAFGTVVTCAGDSDKSGWTPKSGDGTVGICAGDKSGRTTKFRDGTVETCAGNESGWIIESCWRIGAVKFGVGTVGTCGGDNSGWLGVWAPGVCDFPSQSDARRSRSSWATMSN